MKVLTVVGTRPEIIRLSRIMHRFDEYFEHVIVHTGQNYDFELNKIFFDQLNLRKPDHFLQAAGSTASQTIANCIVGLDTVLEREQPDAVVILGDTNSCMSVLAAKKKHIPIFHLEAGNRCFDSRVPEEINRKIIDHMSDINIAYTEHARRNLLAEGIATDQVFVVGSPLAEVLKFHEPDIMESDVLDELNLKANQYLVASFHREENVDDLNRLSQIVASLNAVANHFDMPVILSTHPRTQKRLQEAQLQFDPLIRSMKPFGFFDYVRLQRDAFCTVSDSGTITEEASIMNFPAITLRDAHERPEGTDVGVLVMTGPNAIDMCESIELSRAHLQSTTHQQVPMAYLDLDVSWRVSKIVRSYTGYVNRKTWNKLPPK